jgi:hypothetical protein
MMSSLGLDLGVGNIPSNAAVVFGNIAMNGDEYVRCLTCGYGGCDIRVSGCGCTLHAVRGSCLGFIAARVLCLYCTCTSYDMQAVELLVMLAYG